MSNHCADLAGDRLLGATWERNFARLAWKHGRGPLTPHQIGRNGQSACAYFPDGKKRFLLPDITLWRAPGEHYEIKHKRPTTFNCYGLERYRLDSLLEFASETEQPVLYAIHDWSLALSREDVSNRISEWRVIDVRRLANKWTSVLDGFSYVNGRREVVSICYWKSSMWMSLEKYWSVGDIC